MNTRTCRLSSAAVTALAVASLGCDRHQSPCRVEPVTTESEKAAEEALLAAKLSGPRYFNPRVADPAADDGRWIWLDDALSQVPRITAERNLGPDAEPALRQLLAQLAEPHPYRAVGGQRIDLLRLNLSLDEIK